MSEDQLQKSVTIEGHAFHFPWIDRVPRPSPEKFAEIENSILDNGIMCPILATTDDKVIEGHTRLIVAEKHGFKLAQVPVIQLKCSDEKAQIAAVCLNAVRREWTREMRLETVKRLHALSWGQRQIARAVGTTQSQVRYDLIHLGLIAPDPAPEPTPTPSPEPTPTPVENAQGEQICSPPVADSPAPAPAPPAAGPLVEQVGPAPKDDPQQESTSDRRERLCNRAMEGIRSLVKVFSELNKHDKAAPHIQGLLQLVDGIQKGTE